MATKAVPVRDIEPGDSIKTVDGIRKIQLKQPLQPHYHTGEARWHLFFHGITEPKLVRATDCVHKVIPAETASLPADAFRNNRITPILRHINS